MAAARDPRKPRPNPELPELLRVMTRAWEDFRRARSHRERRGHAAVLAAHIESFLDEPEEVVDLAQGPAESGSSLILPRDPDALGRVADPFALPEIPPGLLLLQPYSGGLTPLLTEDQKDLFDPSAMSGYWVRVLADPWVTPEPTRFHFTSDAAFRRWVGEARARKAGDTEPKILVFADPLGIRPAGAPRLAGRYVHREAAERRAEALAGRFGIRFLVATERALIHTH